MGVIRGRFPIDGSSPDASSSPAWQTTEKNPKTKKKTETTEVVGPRRPLLRSKDDRLIWGVAGGLAAHIGFSATWSGSRSSPDAVRRRRGARLSGPRGGPPAGRRHRQAGGRERLGAAGQGRAGLHPGRDRAGPGGGAGPGQRLGDGHRPRDGDRRGGDLRRPRTGRGVIRNRRQTSSNAPAPGAGARARHPGRRHRRRGHQVRQLGRGADLHPHRRRPTSPPRATSSARASSWSTCASCPGSRARRSPPRPTSGSVR